MGAMINPGQSVDSTELCFFFSQNNNRSLESLDINILTQEIIRHAPEGTHSFATIVTQCARLIEATLW